LNLLLGEKSSRERNILDKLVSFVFKGKSTEEKADLIRMFTEREGSPSKSFDTNSIEELIQKQITVVEEPSIP